MNFVLLIILIYISILFHKFFTFFCILPVASACLERNSLKPKLFSYLNFVKTQSYKGHFGKINAQFKELALSAAEMKLTPRQQSVGKESFGQFTCTSTFAINKSGLQKQHSQSKAHKTANINSTILCIPFPQNRIYICCSFKSFPK